MPLLVPLCNAALRKRGQRPRSGSARLPVLQRSKLRRIRRLATAFRERHSLVRRKRALHKTPCKDVKRSAATKASSVAEQNQTNPPFYDAGDYAFAGDDWWRHRAGLWMYNAKENVYFHLQSGALIRAADENLRGSRKRKAPVEEELREAQAASLLAVVVSMREQVEKAQAKARAPPLKQSTQPLHSQTETVTRSPPPPVALESQFSTAAPARPRAADEIPRIIAAESPEELLGVAGDLSEESVTKAWKKLMLLLHPDKLQTLDAELREAGAEALHRVHLAKEELRRRTQEACAEVPAAPEPAGEPRCLSGGQGSRKFEISWRIPEMQDPRSPVEKYEIWGPKYFSEAGDPFDWVMLASLPPLQSHFVLVEEAPTQQDVMWAADRVLRSTLPIAVNAVNGRGSSEACNFELAWATAFPWLGGAPSVLCPSCLRLNQRKQGFSSCDGCGEPLNPELTSVVVRCPDCHGEVRWGAGQIFGCCSCLRKFGEALPRRKQQWETQKGRGPSAASPHYGQAPKWHRSGPSSRTGRHW